MSTGGHRGTGDHGAGLIGSIAGLLVFLAFLLFAVQLLISLYATSTVTGAAYEGARVVAGRRVDHHDPAAVTTARAAAEQQVRSQLGRFGERVAFDWSASTTDTVALRVRADTPTLLLPGLGRAVGIGHIDRTAHVRVEEMR